MFDPLTGMYLETELDEGEAFAFDHRHDIGRSRGFGFLAWFRAWRRRNEERLGPPVISPPHRSDHGGALSRDFGPRAQAPGGTAL